MANEQRWDTVVVGGGLAGLVAAVTAARAGSRVALLEPRPLGGRARCDDRNGFTFNRGPRALYVGGAARPILDALGVDTASGAAPATRGAVGRLDGQLHLLPQGPWSLLRTSLLRPADKVALARLLARLPRLDAAPLSGTSFDDFLAGTGLSSRGRDVLDMVARIATYAAEPGRVDAAAVVTNVQLALGAGVRYLDGGFQTLVDGLVHQGALAGVEVVAERACAVQAAAADGAARAVTATGRELVAQTVVLAAGTPNAVADLLGSSIAGADHLTEPVTAACLELGLRAEPCHPVLFGIREPLYLSTHRAAGLAPEGAVVVHLMRNHGRHEHLSGTEQRSWLRAAADDAGVNPGDVVEERFLAAMTVSGGLPTPAGGGLAGRPTVTADDRPGVLLAGDWVGHQGLLADAAVASGHRAGVIAARATAEGDGGRRPSTVASRPPG